MSNDFDDHAWYATFKSYRPDSEKAAHMNPDPHDAEWQAIVDAYCEVAVFAAALMLILGAGAASLVWWLV